MHSKKADSDPAHTHAVASAIIGRIKELPTNQRIATYLRHVEQWTAAEIAEVLDIAPATASVHIGRGTATVRKDEGSTLLSGSVPGPVYPRRSAHMPRWAVPISRRAARERVRRIRGLVATVALLAPPLITVWLVSWVNTELALGLGGLMAGIAAAVWGKEWMMRGIRRRGKRGRRKKGKGTNR